MIPETQNPRKISVPVGILLFLLLLFPICLGLLYLKTDRARRAAQPMAERYLAAIQTQEWDTAATLCEPDATEQTAARWGEWTQDYGPLKSFSFARHAVGRTPGGHLASIIFDAQFERQPKAQVMVQLSDRTGAWRIALCDVHAAATPLAPKEPVQP